MCYGVELHRWVFACSLGSFVFGLYIQTLNIQLKITAHVYLCWQHVNPGLTGPTCPSLFLNPFPPRAAEAGPFIIWREFGRIQKYLCKPSPLELSFVFASNYANTGGHLLFLSMSSYIYNERVNPVWFVREHFLHPVIYVLYH